MQMNVTPAEYLEIQRASVEMFLEPGAFEGWMRQRYGCEHFTTYEIVVRKDVPSIPWYTRGVDRFGPDKA